MGVIGIGRPFRDETGITENHVVIRTQNWALSLGRPFRDGVGEG